jgi:hypothetical protein
VGELLVVTEILIYEPGYFRHHDISMIGLSISSGLSVGKPRTSWVRPVTRQAPGSPMSRGAADGRSLLHAGGYKLGMYKLEIQKKNRRLTRKLQTVLRIALLSPMMS